MRIPSSTAWLEVSEVSGTGSHVVGHQPYQESREHILRQTEATDNDTLEHQAKVGTDSFIQLLVAATSPAMAPGGTAIEHAN